MGLTGLTAVAAPAHAVPAGATTAYVANASDNTVSAVDTATNTVTATIPVGFGPQGVAAAPDGAHVYLPNVSSNTVSVIDTTATDSVVATTPVGSSPTAVAVTPNSAHVYVANLGSNTASVIDTATAAVATTTAVGRNPIGVAIGTTVAPVPPPVVTGVSPNTGPPAGGTTVTITGTALSDATAVTFGAGHNAAAVTCSPTSCTAVAPAGTVGTVDVRVTTAAGTSAVSAADHFTYAAADVSVALVAGPAPGLLGGKINYTLTVTNHGPSALTSAAVTAALPTPMTATSSDCGVSAGHINCTVGTLSSGAATTRHFTVPVGLLSLNLPYSVTATRTASAPVDLNSANNSATRTCTVITSLIISCS
ncbi:IPT/TIG domain-containing protein [Streptomyces sp. H39-C1]|uniref:IPT/TIG domain-containing protein n=1 Tax=Streptomyces sp. H39-C1 TaxID=3004355 RepID=UPI0022AE8A06|nr:IPT/TIG domain-containing protein [Streptomyces sp. H39-C1]MCZ4101427.1 IPT/TIG domain-containing protein [Streptomyces sp. H39-C1]